MSDKKARSLEYEPNLEPALVKAGLKPKQATNTYIRHYLCFGFELEP